MIDLPSTVDKEALGELLEKKIKRRYCRAPAALRWQISWI